MCSTCKTEDITKIPKTLSTIAQDLAAVYPELQEKGYFYFYVMKAFNWGFFAGRIKTLLLRRKTTASASNATWFRQPLQPAIAAAAIDGRSRRGMANS